MSLSVAVLDGDKQQIFDLIFRDCNVEEPNDVGNRPLHACAFTGNVDIARLLVKAGADVNARGAKGRTPLHIASALDRGADMVKYLLLECRANPDLKDEFGKTPRDYACETCAEHLDALLLDKWSSLLGLQEGDKQHQTLSNVRSPKATERGYNNHSANEAEALLSALSQIQQGTPAKSIGSQQSVLNGLHPTLPPVLSSLGEPYQADLSKSQYSQSDSLGAKSDVQNGVAHVETLDVSGITALDGSMQASNHDERSSRNDSEGFTVDIDGTKVFIPFSRDPPLIHEDAASLNEDKEDSQEEDEETLPSPVHIIQLSVVLHNGDYGLGMLLGEDDDQVEVRKLRKSLPAYTGGVRVGDVIVSIGGTNVRHSSLPDIVDMLASDEVHLVIERRIPTIILDYATLDWKSPASADRVIHLVDALNNPPNCISEEQLMGLMQSFQTLISLTRSGDEEINRRLQTALEESLDDDSNHVNVYEKAATVILRAVKVLEHLQSDKDAEEESIISEVIREIMK